MLSQEQLMRMGADAATASAPGDYGRLHAQAKCVEHVRTLLRELEQLRAAVQAARGDYSGLNRLAGG